MYWLQEKTFPRAVMDRYAIFQEETWSKLLRPKEGVSGDLVLCNVAAEIMTCLRTESIICG